ncbi:glycosyltransferase family 1 protein [Capnocytophaga sp. G2]|uniref:glycosyltransferase family 4 protein n=1 Tax=Capnocytophaga sp. G2 TaxID=3110695 RepID=UPI002B4A5722|nr:glycosyltransferase family 1 protein [Capnocytophaga sp. G2]MEB3004881.1 glycosyltransferase family 1 protein [Capnocytophaga sp. G2]
MRIGFDAKRAFHNLRGLGNYSRDLIRILQERTDMELMLFNPLKRKFLGVKMTEKTTEINPKGFFWKRFKSLWRLFYITTLAQKERLDIYHGLSGEIPIGIYKYVPTVVTIHDLIFLRFPQWYSAFDRKIHTLKFRYAAQKAQHIIAISEQTKQDIVDYFHIDPNKISVVYQGCHAAFKQTYTEKEKDQVREKYALPDRFVLNVGAIEARKNALEIVKALKGTDLPLIMVGKKTAYYEKVEAYCKENDMQSQVRVLSDVSMQELAMIYQIATIFCYPSVFEGFGIPIIEALFSKTPVITSKGSCFEEAGGSGSIYVNPTEHTALEIRQAIDQLLASSERMQQMKEVGYSYAQKFTDEKVCENLLKVYQELIS